MRQIVLLRGINLGSTNRIAMPALRELLGQAGFQDVGTYLQSGNVALSSELGPDELAAEVRRLIAKDSGLDIAVVARTADELEAVVRLNPLGSVADNPKRYQVSFLSEELPPGELEKLAALATASERFVAAGRELYAWHPEGVARSKLWNRLASANLGVTATARNWTTVMSLHDMVKE